MRQLTMKKKVSPAAASPISTVPSVSVWPVCLALIFVTLAVYWPVAHFDFINFDDPEYVTANPRVLAGLTWDSLIWAFRESHTSNWHPLTWLSHMLDVELFGNAA